MGEITMHAQEQSRTRLEGSNTPKGWMGKTMQNQGYLAHENHPPRRTLQ